jgi:leader peptidase (prepilin peptidase)/N-methyltransferase
VTAVLYAVTAAAGLAIGSFLNVVIWRSPRGLSVVTPPSACPNCQHQLAARDNIPVLSWLLLRGRCRYCQTPISAQYPLVELATAALFVGVLARLGRSWAVPAYCAFMAGLLALGWIDVEHHRLPRPVVLIHLALVSALLALASAVQDRWSALFIGLACAAAWSGVFAAIHFASPRHLGFGDVRFAVVLGLGLGWISARTAIVGFFAANVIGLVVTVVLIATSRTERTAEVPYGIYLASGAAVAFFFGPWLVALLPHS